MRVTGLGGPEYWGGGGPNSVDDEVDVEAQFSALTPGRQDAAQSTPGLYRDQHWCQEF